MPDINSICWEIDLDEDPWETRDLSSYTIVHYDINFNPDAPIEDWYHNAMIRRRGIIIYHAPKGRELPPHPDRNKAATTVTTRVKLPSMFLLISPSCRLSPCKDTIIF